MLIKTKKDYLLKQLLLSSEDVALKFNLKTIESENPIVMNIDEIDVKVNKPFFNMIDLSCEEKETYERLSEDLSLFSSEQLESHGNGRNEWIRYVAKYTLSYLNDYMNVTKVSMTITLDLSSSYDETELGNFAYNAFRDTIRNAKLTNAKHYYVPIPESLEGFDKNPVVEEFVIKAIRRHL